MPTVVVHDAVAERREEAARAARQAVGFRLMGNHTISGIIIGGALGLVLMTIWPSIGAAGLVFVPLLGALGFGVGRESKTYTCTGCRHVVPAGAKRCGHCGLRLLGDLDRPEDRFDAGERYYRRRREKRAGRSTRS